MRVLDRYIVKAICGHVTLVMAVLLTLVALFLFINEQGWVGVGRYGSVQALRFVAFNLPAAAVQFLPIGALIGSLLALGSLARGSEITVMRAAGVSVARLCLAVAAAGLLLVPLAFAVGEWIAPPLGHQARVTKAAERSGSLGALHSGGVWVRDGNRILHADGHGDATGTGAVTVYELGADGDLQQVLRARDAQQASDDVWLLEDVAASRFGAQGVGFGTGLEHSLATRSGGGLLGEVTGDPGELALHALAESISHLERNGQDARRYRFAYWSAIARLAAIPLAVLLAVPLLFGALRNAEGGARMTLGLLLGLGYFIFQRMVESGTIAFGLDPLLLAWMPTALLAAGVVVLLSRRRFPSAA